MLLVPLVFSVVQQTKVPPIYLGIPLFASLSVTHGYLPPHPAPTAMLPLFGADMGKTLFYGIIVALPAMICAGPLYARLFRNVKSNPITLFVAPLRPESELPSAFNCFASALLPVVLIACLDGGRRCLSGGMEAASLNFWTNPLIVMLLGLAVATWTLGLSRGMKIQPLMDDYGNSVKDIAVILLIIAGAGTLKEVFVATGVDKNISDAADRDLHRSAGAGLADRRRDPRVAGLGHGRRSDRRRDHGAGGCQCRRRSEPHGAGHRRR